MSIRYDCSNALTSKRRHPHFLHLSEIRALRRVARRIHRELAQRRQSGELGFFDLYKDRLLVQAVTEFGRRVRNDFENFVVLGIGGSALGPICLQSALAHPYYNTVSRKERGGPRVFVLDNCDPEPIATLAASLDLRKTCFNVVTKSGTTPETMTAMMVFYSKLKRIYGKKAAQNLPRHFIATTDPKTGILRALAEKENFPTLPIPPNVGGRFSVLSAVGLLPAAVLGIDVDELMKGAAAADRACSKDDLLKNPAYLNGAIHFLADTTRAKVMSVMMPYSNALRDVADWYRQLWAESLGKHKLRGRKAVGVGQTPIKALGVTDQHSQIQLYVEGPNDKIITFVTVEKFKPDLRIPKVLPASYGLDHFASRAMSELLNAEAQATEFALTRAERPNVKFIFDKISAHNVGAFFQMLEIQTAFCGGLYQINAFDQPGVEEGKKATHALLGRGKPEDLKKVKEVQAFEKRKGSQWLLIP
ncbi:MAG: glucose-6-phosphate isomerase [bacterium]